MEEIPTNMDKYILELQNQLKSEKDKNHKLETKILELKERIIDLSTQTEAEEEAITMKLMRRMNDLKREKEELTKQVDVEEDHITNTLLKKLDKLQKEKTALEQKLEYEQENMVNRLQRQIAAIHREKMELKSRLREDTQVLLRTIQSSIELLQQARSSSATPALEPHPVDINADMEEVSKRLTRMDQSRGSGVSTPSVSVFSIPNLPLDSPRSMADNQMMQEKVIEGERKMREVLRVVNNMERSLNHSSDVYESFPQQTVVGGVVLDDATTRLRTGSISSARSRSNSIIQSVRERSRHASVSE